MIFSCPIRLFSGLVRVAWAIDLGSQRPAIARAVYLEQRMLNANKRATPSGEYCQSRQRNELGILIAACGIGSGLSQSLIGVRMKSGQPAVCLRF